MSKILIVTEAYGSQLNGVIRTLIQTKEELEKLNFTVVFVTPAEFKSFPCPTYNEIRLVSNPWKIGKIIKKHKPDYIHVATEGPLAFAAVRYCKKHKLNFTTSYHTKLPEYVNARYWFIKPSWVYAYLRMLHKHSKSVLVTTDSMKQELEEKGFKNLCVWGRGVDQKTFNSNYRSMSDEDDSYKILLYVGRISIEKNIDAFLNLETIHQKVVVGDGPLLQEYKARYTDVYFMGALQGRSLASEYANADVFVFPSRSDTFGIVMIEATACGTPVAAYPVTGPIDYVKQGITGWLDEDLGKAVEECLKISRTECEVEAMLNTWEAATKIFVQQLIKA